MGADPLICLVAATLIQRRDSVSLGIHSDLCSRYREDAEFPILRFDDPAAIRACPNSESSCGKNEIVFLLLRLCVLMPIGDSEIIASPLI
jgi:hypothetical protein